MRWTLLFMATLALAACSSSDDRTKPIQQEKAADVKTEAAGEHFQHGMSQPDKLMQAMQKTTPAKTLSTAVKPSPEMVEIVWQRCSSCHSLTHSPKTGPGLAGIIGRTAGTEPGFHYQFTQYIKGKPWVWDEAHLKKWMCDAKEAVREFTGDPYAETNMPAMHICSPEGQASVLSKLQSAS